ncbi:excalibur calcium-binding domain-containing protein [Psychrobacter sp. I-STPA10]|uniref:excalibur calcium-binding domain-containing protein n=1 Tax=Psychrobacter sp. I-STPA10 TaxID=2585769 RepID=UPI001E48B854|nr:excalibur calcium-binding domain-containing protein [Psychrobacter sp. I-STPA10]
MKKLAILISFTIIFTPLAHAKQRVTCKDFKTQKEAQAWYEQRKRAGQKGWKALDRDKDGQACNCLPGGNGTHCPKKK